MKASCVDGEHMLRKRYLFVFFALIVQDVFCTRIIGEYLEYKSYRSANIQEENRELFQKEQDFFTKLYNEIVRWQYIDFNEIANEIAQNIVVLEAKKRLNRKLTQESITLKPTDYSVALAGEVLGYGENSNPRDDFDWLSLNVVGRACSEIISKEILNINQHISFARIIALDIENGKPSCRIFNIPCIFLSGTYASNGNDLKKNMLGGMVRFIDNYNFYSTSDQSYSHSERAICLALSQQYGDFKLSDFITSNTKDVCIQIKNMRRMCINCEHFLCGTGVYFINVGQKGCFVTSEYKEDYNKVSTNEGKRNFINKYCGALKLDNSIVGTLKSTDLDGLFEHIKPRNISELIPHAQCSVLVLETVKNDYLSEVVKVYLP